MTEPSKKRILLLTCEHGGNEVPEEFAPLFQGQEAVLASHRGWDPGALPMARHLSALLDTRLVFETLTRQLVEQNRTRSRPTVWSSFSSQLPEDVRARLLQTVYDPFHDRTLAHIHQILGQDRPSSVAHFSIHSFTPVMNGVVRTTDIGVLYDPRRRVERVGGLWLQERLQALLPDLRTRRNYPYTGYSDGHTTALRKRFPEADYAGFEIEVNQKFFLEDRRTWERIRDALVQVLGEYRYRGPEPVSGP